MITGYELIEKMYSENYDEYEDEKLYSTGDDYLDDLLEKAFCDGYEYAQREFTTLDAAGNVRRNDGSLAMTAQQFNNAPRVVRAGNKAVVYEKPTILKKDYSQYKSTATTPKWQPKPFPKKVVSPASTINFQGLSSMK